VIILKAICVTAKNEWKYLLEYFNVKLEECEEFPFGEYFIKNNILYFRSGVRKTNSVASVQYMIDNKKIDNLFLIGTCCGIDKSNNILDIIIPNKSVQYDCTIVDYEPLFKEMFTTDINTSNINFEFKTGIIATADRAVVRMEEFNLLTNNGVTIADTECGAISYVCKKNNIKFLAIKGISDFPIENKDPKESDEIQTNLFLNNIPIILKNILDNYIPKII
jgi:nucleoside phosphorylase